MLHETCFPRVFNNVEMFTSIRLFNNVEMFIGIRLFNNVTWDMFPRVGNTLPKFQIPGMWVFQSYISTYLFLGLLVFIPSFGWMDK